MAKNYARPFTSPVRIAPGKDGLRIYDVSVNTPADEVFKSDEGNKIFEVAKSSGMPMSTASFWLAGVEAAIRGPYVDKDTGETKQRGLAYSAEQIAAFNAKSCKLVSRWNGRGFSTQLQCFETSYEDWQASKGGATKAASNLKRNAASASTQAAQPAGLKRGGR